MRNFAPLMALFLLATSAPLAAAHRTHDECASETYDGIQTTLFHIDSYGYGEGCYGVTIATGGQCSLEHDYDGKYTHVLLGYGQACQTGLILDLP